MTKDKRALRQLATQFVIYGKTLYRRLDDGMLLLCLNRTSVDLVMREGINIIGKISPKSSNGHEFILVSIDYFTKWVEAASYEVHFKADVNTLLQRYGIQRHRSSTYRLQTNGVVKAANKNIKRILWRMIETSQDWSEKLPFALWAYQTSFHTFIGATPYSLVYGMEVVLPIKINMGSLRVALEQHI
ncbi:hypothetical protein CK203_109672 [Vitis vinifera]|uniref:Integrase catalytic domain-containing protein n=1 Tax=Vitis vinifera TaxID=29760 RepID=A0A438CF86_VITVI|nr:hypothetical protein CK203_109672 [Vitis vinifera]